MPGEPSYETGPHTDWIRLGFDDPVMCDPAQTFTRMPATHACDFRLGQVHKGYSERISDLYQDIAWLMDHYKISPPELVRLETAFRTRHASANASENDVYDIACEWVRQHQQTWFEWLRDPLEKPAWKHTTPLVLLGVVVMITLFWVLLPVYMARPEVLDAAHMYMCMRMHMRTHKMCTHHRSSSPARQGQECCMPCTCHECRRHACR